jgi:hypothetical protein
LTDLQAGEDGASVVALVSGRERSAEDLGAIEGCVVGEQEGDDADPESGEEQAIVPRHLADDDEGRERSLGGRGEEAGHSQDDICSRMRDQRRPEGVEEESQATTATAADDHGGAKDTARPTAADREAGRDDLSESDCEQEERGQGGLPRECFLEDAVAEGEDRKCADVVVRGGKSKSPMSAASAAPIAGLRMRGIGILWNASWIP